MIAGTGTRRAVNACKSSNHAPFIQTPGITIWLQVTQSGKKNWPECRHTRPARQKNLAGVLAHTRKTLIFVVTYETDSYTITLIPLICIIMKKLLITFAIALLASLVPAPSRAQAVQAAAPQPQPQLVTISGTVKDAKNGHRLPYVSITLVGTNTGTVSNSDGGFSIKVPQQAATAGRLLFSCLGYANTYVDATPHERLTVTMPRRPRVLSEITIKGVKARDLVAGALDRIAANYSPTTDMDTLFYRETIQKGRRYVGITEAVMEVYKTPYKHRSIGRDKVQPLKSRALMSQRSSDTLAVKIAGGPYLAVVMDFVKNADILIDDESLSNYDYRLLKPVNIDERPCYVVAFKPVVILDHALYSGRLYIDCETMAFTRAELELDMSDKRKVTRMLLQHKPAGLMFNPLDINITISYKQVDGIAYLNHIENRMRFKCDWKKRLFHSTYTAAAELVITGRDLATTRTVTRSGAFRPRQVFADMVSVYNDPDFWARYNIIEPTQSLEKAADKLKRQR